MAPSVSSVNHNDDETWARVAGQLQAHMTKYGSYDVRIPVFTLLGMQSAGKSRLLNIFAGQVVTGAIQDKTGTRCPCVFTFRNGSARYRFGTDPQCLEECALAELWVKVTEHMKQLGETAPGFSEAPLYLEVSTPNALDVVVNDLPGVKPDDDDPANLLIIPMIQSTLARPNTTAIVVTSLGDKADLDFVKAEQVRLKRACGPQAVVLAHAIVLVSRLDVIRNTLNGPDKLQDLRRELQAIGLVKDPKNFIFLSLKPHLLNGAKEDKVSDMSDKSKFDFEKENVYYATIMDVEQRELPRFLAETHITAERDLYFGIRSAKGRMQGILVSSLRQNLYSVVRTMNNNRAKLAETAKSYLSRDEVRKVQKLIASYVRCLVTVVSHVCNTDKPGFLVTLQEEQTDFPNHVQVPTDMDVIETLRLSFLDEQLSIQRRCEKMGGEHGRRLGTGHRYRFALPVTA
jgi:hypothetical protein